MSILFNEFAKIKKIASTDLKFPPALQSIDKPPRQLYFLGSAPDLWVNRPKVAIVGSRRISGYGRVVTQKLATELAGRGVVIISGLALGIDSVAHRSALDAGGVTVAVLPTPLHKIYPAAHLGLARSIVSSGGCLISEYPADAEIYKINFVARNRIVSGLADILLITEAALSSGTMHTARFALNQGKTVMAVPGNIDQAGSEGTNNLIKSGAIPATNVKDLLFALNLPLAGVGEKKTSAKLTDQQAGILDLIREGVSDQQELADRQKITAASINSELTMLEIAGLIKPLGAGRWSVG